MEREVTISETLQDQEDLELKREILHKHVPACVNLFSYCQILRII